MDQETRQRLRFFLKDTIRQQTDFSQTDQAQGKPPPPIEKPYRPDARRLPLPGPEAWRGIASVPLQQAIAERRSVRRFTRDPLTVDELAFLLWATQGIREQVNPATALRTVPSAGARHALETYLCVLNVEGLEPGIYRYLPMEHELIEQREASDLARRLATAVLGQAFAGQAAVTFVWTAIPYRMEWRYGEAAHKVIALDAGHVCQNLYLSCRAIGAGACAIAAYHQQAMDRLLGVDGEDEFTLYLAPVGKV